MNKLTLFVLALALAVACKEKAQNHDHDGHDHDAQASAFPADSVGADGRSFHGYRIDETGAMPVAELLPLVNENAEVKAKITGVVAEVCQNKGCWMTIEKPDGSLMRVSFLDYGFFMPKDCAGRTAVMRGVAYLDTTSVDDLRHFAEDAGKSKEEIEKITEPEISIAFEADGVVIK